jgi:hypothetical protein
MMEREMGQYENEYMSKKEMFDEISYCAESLGPYYRKEKPIDSFYRRCKGSLFLMFDALCSYCDEDLESVKKKDKKMRNKIMKRKNFYVKMLSKYEKVFLKIEGRMSIDKEIAEAMQLINKGIAESQS